MYDDVISSMIEWDWCKIKRFYGFPEQFHLKEYLWQLPRIWNKVENNWKRIFFSASITLIERTLKSNFTCEWVFECFWVPSFGQEIHLTLTSYHLVFSAWITLIERTLKSNFTCEWSFWVFLRSLLWPGNTFKPYFLPPCTRNTNEVKSKLFVFFSTFDVPPLGRKCL